MLSIRLRTPDLGWYRNKHDVWQRLGLHKAYTSTASNSMENCNGGRFQTELQLRGLELNQSPTVLALSGVASRRVCKSWGLCGFEDLKLSRGIQRNSKRSLEALTLTL